jgi:hypothetical protein
MRIDQRREVFGGPKGENKHVGDISCRVGEEAEEKYGPEEEPFLHVIPILVSLVPVNRSYHRSSFV